jgi:UDP-3-O-[3-hydroxymyristoyl] glucosamine N-acyltransferase
MFRLGDRLRVTRQWLRVSAAQARLPDLLKHVQHLEARLKALELAALEKNTSRKG